MSGLSTTRGEKSKDSLVVVAVLVPIVTFGTLCLARLGWLVAGAVSSAVVTKLALEAI